MKLGLLTSWNTICGISEYSRYLADAFRKIPDINLTVLGSRNYDERKIKEDEDYVIGTFDVQPWNRYGAHEFDVEMVCEQRFDVLHVQYESVLYNAPRFYQLLDQFQGLKVLTYHDNCIPPDFPYEKFHLRYAHRGDFGVGDRFLLPMGIEARTPVVKTFGLGRSRDDIIGEICLKNGWHFEKSFGEQDWKPTKELLAWLRDSDAIVLYYEDVPSAGSSIAARVAISTRRPVFVNETTWFAGLHTNEIPNLKKVTSSRSLEMELGLLFEHPYMDENSWDRLARGLMEDYENGLKCLAEAAG